MGGRRWRYISANFWRLSSVLLIPSMFSEGREALSEDDENQHCAEPAFLVSGDDTQGNEALNIEAKWRWGWCQAQILTDKSLVYIFCHSSAPWRGSLQP